MFGYAGFDRSRFSDIELDIIDNLPHGSGINCDWHISKTTRGKVVCHNSYQVMNETGFYIGYADFSIRFGAEHPADFRLMFHGRQSQYLAQYYQLRDYLEDTIFWSLPENNRPAYHQR